MVRGKSNFADNKSQKSVSSLHQKRRSARKHDNSSSSSASANSNCLSINVPWRKGQGSQIHNAQYIDIASPLTELSQGKYDLHPAKVLGASSFSGLIEENLINNYLDQMKIFTVDVATFLADQRMHVPNKKVQPPRSPGIEVMESTKETTDQELPCLSHVSQSLGLPNENSNFNDLQNLEN